MKTKNANFWFLIILMLLASSVLSQNVSISEDESYTPDPAAMLDVYSLNKGFLIPRIALVTTTNPISVTKPIGLMVWNTSTTGTYSTPGFYFWDGADWKMVGANSLAFQNGITQSGNSILLGGALTETTTITQGAYGMIYNLNATGDFDIQDNGTSAFFVGDNGNVGVGTSSPAHKLHVYGDNSNVAGTDGMFIDIQNSNNSTGVLSGIRFQNGTTANTFKGGIFYSDVSGFGRGDMLFVNNTVGSATNATTADAKMVIKYTGNVGIGTTSPNTSAMVDITATDKGVLVPRMTTVQRNSIASPANGLLVFDTDHSNFFYYNTSKTKWINLAAITSSSITTDALFAVVNNNGDTVFAVYPEGVQINVGDGVAKGTKGGFAVAGIGTAKGAGNEYMRVTNDSVRIYVEEGAKGTKGGFAVAGIGTAKGVGNEYLRISNDSVRIYVEDGAKGTKGGFAVAGIGTAKGLSNEYMRITNDSVRIYVEDGAKGTKGGFAVAGIGTAKGVSQDIMKITKDSTRIFVADPNAGFSIGNTSSGTEERLMKLTKENYFIGHESGIKIILGLGDNGRYNSFLGYQAGKSATTGFRNVLLGYQSGLNLNQGYDNIFIGYKSGLNVTNAFNNVFIGTNVGANSTGSSNIFIGDSVGFTNTSGYDNVFMGFATGKANTDGHHNVFLGSNSAKSNTSGYDNVMIGANAGFNNMDGASNVMVGDRVGYSNTTGSYNVILGNLAGYKNTEGADNILMGYKAGYENIDGTGNVYIGKESGHTDTNGSDNVYIGKQAGYTNALGIRNVFIGSEAGKLCDASENTYIGFQAGVNANGHFNTLVGTNAGYNRLSGNSSVIMGTEAGYYQQGSDNTILGAYAGRGSSAKTGSKNVFIGYSAGYWETGGNKLYIESCDNNTSDSYNPLIYGDFQLNQVVINNALAINNNKTAPTAALDVSGDAKISGTLSAGSLTGTLTGNVNTGYAGYTGYSATGPRFQYFSTTAKLYGEGLLVDDGTYIGTAYNGPRIVFDDTNDEISVEDADFGIGTSSPSYKLHVVDQAATVTSGATSAYFSSTGGATSGTAYGIRAYSFASGSSNSYAVYADGDGGSTTGNEYAFYGIGNSYFSGDVGIGAVASTSSKLNITANSTTSYPHLKLIETSVSDGARIEFGNSEEPTNTWTLYGRGDDTDASSSFNIYYSALGNIITANGNGNVGIYRSAAANRLEVNGDASKSVAGSWLANSDKRIKTDISDINNSFETILKLRPVKFKYTEEWKKRNPSIQDKYYYNFIAQEYQNVFPESVKGSGEYLDNDTEEILQIDSYNAQIVTIKAVQELILKSEEQQKQIDALKTENAELKAKQTNYEQLKADVDKIKASLQVK